MPWKETCAMDQRVKMISDWLSDQYSISELGQIYEVSRKTIYKWIGRYQAEGPSGLEEHSRAPRSHPNATPLEIASQIVMTKLNHQSWGPKKIVVWLERQHPQERWPAPSTAGEILKRERLVRRRRRKHRTPPYPVPLIEGIRVNEVWSADFKGQFRMGDGKLCYPLTITDNSSRYLLLCRGLSRPTFAKAQPWFERAFREYGLPEAIRTDNGVPFASVGLGGLSKLSIWFIKLGIWPERIEPAHPEQNGRHERMHRSLKEATAMPPKNNMLMQQWAFDEFVQEYDFQRPHEALEQRTPSTIYQPSERTYPAKIREVEYDEDVIVRRVRHNGEIKWRGKLVYVSEALAGETIALKQKEDHLWEIRFRFYPLGVLNELTGKIAPLLSRGRKVLPKCPV